jgi:hypothetical protein
MHDMPAAAAGNLQHRAHAVQLRAQHGQDRIAVALDGGCLQACIGHAGSLADRRSMAQSHTAEGEHVADAD